VAAHRTRAVARRPRPVRPAPRRTPHAGAGCELPRRHTLTTAPPTAPVAPTAPSATAAASTTFPTKNSPGSSPCGTKVNSRSGPAPAAAPDCCCAGTAC
jgi:hypothetical protein